jgi:hypothetical protein
LLIARAEPPIASTAAATFRIWAPISVVKDPRLISRGTVAAIMA